MLPKRTHLLLQPYGCWGVGQPVLKRFFLGGGVSLQSAGLGGGAPCPHKVQQDLRADPFLHSLGHRVGGVTPNH